MPEDGRPQLAVGQTQSGTISADEFLALLSHLRKVHKNLEKFFRKVESDPYGLLKFRSPSEISKATGIPVIALQHT